MMFEKIKSRINLSSQKKNVFKISFGTLVGQGVTFITLPILTRMYGATAIGVFTVFTSIANIILSFSDLGLTNAIMVEEDDEVVLKIYKVVSTIVMILSIISGVFCTIYYSIRPEENGMDSLFIGIFIIVAAFTLQQIQTCYTWLNRKGKYDVLMKNPIINNVIFGVAAIIFGILKMKTYGYFIGWFLGQIITLMNMKRYLPISTFTNKKDDYVYVFKKYKNFIKFQLPSNITMKVKNQIPTLLIKSFFGTKMVGYYSITVRLLQIPISLLASAIGRVFFKTITDMKRTGKDISQYVYNNMIKVMKIAVIPMIFLLLIGDYAVVIFVGDEWKIAGDFLRILALQNFFMFLTQTVQGLSVTLNKQKYSMIFYIAQSVTFIGSLFVGRYIFNNVYVGILLMSITFIICNICFFCGLFKVMNVSITKYLKKCCFYIALILILGEGIRLVLFLLGIVNSL